MDVAAWHWEKELGVQLAGEDWDRINVLAHSGSVCVAVQENGYKIYSRLYSAPLLLH